MPHGVKICQNEACKKDVRGCRTKICPHCGHEFETRDKAITDAMTEAGILHRGTWTVPDEFDVPDAVAYNLRPIYVPSGVPPVRLKLVNGEIPEDEAVYDWTVNVRNAMITKGCWMENHALAYWARGELFGYGIDFDDPRTLRLEELIGSFPDYRTVEKPGAVA